MKHQQVEKRQMRSITMKVIRILTVFAVAGMMQLCGMAFADDNTVAEPIAADDTAAVEETVTDDTAVIDESTSDEETDETVVIEAEADDIVVE